MNLQMASKQRPDTIPSNNGTDELIANLDHDLLGVRVRAVKCLLRKLECGIVSLESLKDRVDLVDRCKLWLSKAHEKLIPVNKDGSTELRLDGSEVEGIELLIKLLCILSKHKEFRNLLRTYNLDNLLSKLSPYLVGDFYKSQLDALLNAIVIGQYELSYEGSPSEWFDNKTCPAPHSARALEMYNSAYQKPYNNRGYGDDTGSPFAREDSDSSRNSRNTPVPEAMLSKNVNIPLASEQGWIKNIPFFVPSVYLSGTDKRVIHSTTESLSATTDSLVLMTVSFVRDTLVMDYPPEFFIQEPSIVLALAQVTVGRWADPKIPYTAIQTLQKISRFLRFRFAQLNCSDQYEVPRSEQKPGSSYYDYDALSYSSRMTSKTGPSNPTPTDGLIENFSQLFKSLSRSLLYTSCDLHIWSVFDSFAFTLLKCVTIFPVDSKSLTLTLQGILMELGHIWERKNDYNTTVGLCLVTSSILSSLKHHNEKFIVSKDVRNMLQNISSTSAIRSGWPEVCQHFLQFSELFDPIAGVLTDLQQKNTSDEEVAETHPKKRMLKQLYAIQNASSHEEVLESVDCLRDVLLPIVFNSRFGHDALSYILHDMPWRDTFYRFLCVEPRTDEDEELLGRVLDLFVFILQNVINARSFKWITPLCCEKSSTTLKLLGSPVYKPEMRYGGTALTDLSRSLFDFYEVVLKHGGTLVSNETTLELFQIYTSILNSLEESSYSNFALLTAVTRSLANISENENIQSKLKENHVLPIALIYRMTDAVMVLEANGSIYDGYKNNAALYYLSVCITHMLLPVIKCDNSNTLNSDWIQRCGKTFHILNLSPDIRVKSQAYQLCEIMTCSVEAKRIFAEVSFRSSVNFLLQMAYSAFIDPKNNASTKFRAGNVIVNLLRTEDESLRFKLVKMLQQEFPVLVDISRMSSHPLWSSKISTVLKGVKPDERAGESGPDGIPFITPKVLTVLCKILMTYMQALVIDPSDVGEREEALHDVTSSGICQMIFRIILNHPLKSETVSRVWLDCCCSISTVLEALINLSQLDRTVSIILIGEKRCLSSMLSLLDLELPKDVEEKLEERMETALSALCGNILTLGTILCCDAGNNFEDLERVAWSHQSVLFTKLNDWLKVTVASVSRRCAISFVHGFLSVLSLRTKPGKDSEEQDPLLHPFLCRNCMGDRTYGHVLCENLVDIIKDSVDTEERLSSMKSLTALFNLSPSAVLHAVENSNLVQFTIKKIQGFGTKFFEAKGLSSRKNKNTLHTETLCCMQLLSCLFYVSSEAKKIAWRCHFPDILHKIFGWWTNYGDLNLLHTYVEALLNFTEKYPEGALALTMTSSIVGVPPRRVPTQQSIFIEILAILEKELIDIENNNPNLKTIEIIFELLKNICFVQECRNILLKSPVLLFIRKLHVLETKKWGQKQNTVKANYLEFLVHASVHSDVQICMAKLPECLEILAQLAGTNPPFSLLPLKVLRNLCFNPSNRGRLLTENMIMPMMSHKLMITTDLEEIEYVCVSLWALIANCEKGRLTAKKAYCEEGLSKALERVRKLEQTAPDKDLSGLASLVETVQNLLSNMKTDNSKLSSSSRSCSESQL